MKLCQCALFIHKWVSKKLSCVKSDFLPTLIQCYTLNSHICEKSYFLLFYSFLVKFSEKDRGSGRVKLTKCDEVEWGEKCHYASYIVFE